jgi:hypothetical protein
MPRKKKSRRKVVESSFVLRPSLVLIYNYSNRRDVVRILKLMTCVEVNRGASCLMCHYPIFARREMCFNLHCYSTPGVLAADDCLVPCTKMVVT